MLHHANSRWRCEVPTGLQQIGLSTLLSTRETFAPLPVLSATDYHILVGNFMRYIEAFTTGI